MTSQPIDIVMVTFNRIEMTQKAIQYLADRTRTSYRLIVVDNGSTDGTVAFLCDSLQVHKRVFFDDNRGIHWAKNAGLRHVHSRYYVDTDNDILCADLDPDWLSRLIGLMNRHKDFGAIACRPQVMVGSPGGLFDDCGEIKEMHAGASLRIMRTDAVRRVGGWERIIRPGRDHEEYWIASRLREIRYKTGYAKDVRCWHSFGDDNWGYGDISMEVHGHNPIWPLPSTYDKIPCDPKTWVPL